MRAGVGFSCDEDSFSSAEETSEALRFCNKVGELKRKREIKPNYYLAVRSACCYVLGSRYCIASSGISRLARKPGTGTRSRSRSRWSHSQARAVVLLMMWRMRQTR